MEILRSQIDNSVNFIYKNDIECRFVQRQSDYFIIYLSSFNGCDKACRFCWLTQTGQTSMRTTTEDEFLDQIRTIYDNLSPSAKKIHINFMARGEPLSNSLVDDKLLDKMEAVIREYDASIEIKFKISTIMPIDVDLVTRFKKTNVEIYYSLYSLDVDGFRKKWIPKAKCPHESLSDLAHWAVTTGNNVKLHYTFIEGENDSLESTNEIISAVQDHIGFKPKFNIVRFNPFDRKYKESNIVYIHRHMDLIKSNGFDVKLVSRVGTDVYASCGMFQ